MILCWPDNELTISSYSLGSELLHIREDLSHNSMLMDNMELPLYNGSSNHFCLCALYSLPSTTPLVLQQPLILCRKLTFLSNPILYSLVN